jgi:thiol-disulfide isomerase/thioredoxin
MTTSGTDRRLVRIGMVVLVLAAAAWLGKLAFAGGPGAVFVGAPAPGFRGAVIGTPGAYRTMADYRGEVVLLNLWATWCVPCVTEMPSIERLHRRFRDAGLRVVGIAVDDPPFGDRVAAFVREHGISFEILHEGSGKVEQDYRSRGIPVTYIIGRDGRIRVIRQGATDWDTPASHAVVAQLLGAAGERDSTRDSASHPGR